MMPYFSSAFANVSEVMPFVMVNFRVPVESTYGVGVGVDGPGVGVGACVGVGVGLGVGVGA